MAASGIDGGAHPARDGRFDVAVIGAGIVGLATARAVQAREPDARVLVLEREAAPALHQTGRNSGVVHTGIYYAPGSRKARLCRDGHGRMLAFCEEHGLPLRRCGKVVVAVEERERPALEDLARRAEANDVPVRRLDAGGLAGIEPHVAGVAALHVPGAAITDYAAVARRLAALFERDGGTLVLSAPLRGVGRGGARAGSGSGSGSGAGAGAGLATDAGPLVLETGAGRFEAGRLVSCAGLGAARVARAAGASPSARIVPFRGRYHELAPSAATRVRGLVYPVPDPVLPFLGVHLTPTVDGRVLCGPNAGPAWRTSPADGVQDSWARLLAWPGAWRLLWRHRGTGFREWRRAADRPAFRDAVRRLLPSLRDDELRDGPSGIRAQAVSPDGTLVDDFHVVGEAASPSGLHVLNAPSPAATSALALGDALAAEALAPPGRPTSSGT